MFRQFLKLEVRGSNDRVYVLNLEESSPLGEICDALSTMKAVVLKQMNDQHERELKESQPPLECCKEESSECCKESGEE